MKKICRVCSERPALPQRTICQPCRNDQRYGRSPETKEVKASRARIADDFATLKPEDFDVSVGNVGGIDANAAKEKRQEFSKAMGRFSENLRENVLDDSDGSYVAKLAEQERRFANRRLARSVSLATAVEALALRQFKQAASEYLGDKITATGFATKKRAKPAKRSVVALLSDWHIGADLEAIDEPNPFTAVQEARRLEKVLREIVDFKPQHRDSTEAVICLNGDLIEGQLLHDLRSGAPLTEQKVAFWSYTRAFLAEVSSRFPSVRVFCQPGNHGRDKVRHPGRATSRKWDGHEFELYWGLKEMCSGLRNVTFQIDFRAITAIDLHGSNVGLTHGDTEILLKSPLTGAAQNANEFDKVNSSNVFGKQFAAWMVGHFHSALYVPGTPSALYNGALVPPNGHARASGYTGRPCGQWVFESVEGFPIGDLRFVQVDGSTDNDETLGKIIKPFRF